MLLGHENKIKTFTRLTEAKALGHGYLFCGPPETGKKTFAVALAGLLQYGDFSLQPRPLSDTLIVNQERIGIDEARALKKFILQTPLVSERRIAIIDNAERITWQAQPAFLKIAEEPPSRALLIFIASTTQALSPALLSRLAKFHFGGVSRAAISEFLQKERGASSTEAEAIAARSFGRVGRALKLMEGAAPQAAKTDGLSVSLAESIEKAIAELYLADFRKNATKIKFLLAKLECAARFNLNPRIQTKAIKTFFPEFSNQ